MQAQAKATAASAVVRVPSRKEMVYLCVYVFMRAQEHASGGVGTHLCNLLCDVLLRLHQGHVEVWLSAITQGWLDCQPSRILVCQHISMVSRCRDGDIQNSVRSTGASQVADDLCDNGC